MNKIQMKSWNETKTNDSWSIFKIMSEFLSGYEKLSSIGPCISIFGSARTKSNHPTYILTVEIAKAIAKSGYGVITGGGPGIMEAANKGASEVGGISVGLSINSPIEQESNKYIDKDKLIDFQYFFVRKVMLVKYAQGFIVMPGGFGTLDELFESFSLLQTLKINKFPVILVGRNYWEGFVDWIKDKLLRQNNISIEDLKIFEVVDTVEEVIECLNLFYKIDNFKPNF